MGIYYGWVITGIALMLSTITVGSTFVAFGLFVVPASKALALSRAEINTALILLSLGMAVTAPFIGRALDKFSIRRIMLASTLVFGGSLVVLGLSSNLWLSSAVIALPLAASMSGAGPLAANVLVARWFSVHRGRAIAIAGVGTVLGAVIMAPPIGFAVEHFGWRSALVGMGAAAGGILFVLALFVRDKPGPQDIETTSAVQTSAAAMPLTAADARPMAPAQFLRTPHFWLISLSAAFGLGVIQTLAATVVPLARDAGISAAAAAGLLSIYGVGSVAGKLSLAVVADRINKIALLAVLLCAVAAANATFLLGDTYAFLAFCAAVVGLCAGAVSPAFISVLAERFGPASFGTAHGLSAPILTIIGAVCIRFAGEVFDRTGSYDLLFISFMAILLMGAALMLWVRMTSPSSAQPAPA